MLGVNKIRRLARYLSPGNTILLEYPVNPAPRWDMSSPHSQLLEILNADRARYKEVLESFLRFIPSLLAVNKLGSKRNPTEPCWINSWIPALDCVALYSFIALRRPRKYIEIGSGNSTKFAYRSVLDNEVGTEIISIDPDPRAEIDDICSTVIRQPVEDVDLDMFGDLQENDILYVDDSHTVFMNSDATVVFLDIIPRLNRGVIVEIHDVTLPYDYPREWVGRYYSEQYLLASYLLAGGNRFKVILPSYFVSYDNGLRSILNPLWNRPEMQDVQTHGCSFWIQML